MKAPSGHRFARRSLALAVSVLGGASLANACGLSLEGAPADGLDGSLSDVPSASSSSSSSSTSGSSSGVTSSSSGTPVEDAGADVVVPPLDAGGCDPNDPAADCITDEKGVYVANNGDDANAGTRAEPVKTVAAALTKLAGRPFVFVCRGNYPGLVEIKDSVSIVGNLLCDGGNWRRGGNEASPPRGTFSAPGMVFHVGNGAAVHLVELLVRADSSTDNAQPNSVALWVNGGAALVATGCSFTASRGIDFYMPPTPAPAAAGANAVAEQPGATCSPGGAGGTVATPNGAHGEQAGAPPNGPGVGGCSSSSMVNCHPPAVGGNCGPGVNGKEGALPAEPAEPNAPGQLLATGWVPADGATGSDGNHGGGGGGGGFTDVAAAVNGGGGGGGGCAGLGGKGGRGGGASVGVMVHNASFVATNSAIVTGAGGNGAPGGTGGGSGAGGYGTSVASTCNGGRGGAGSGGVGGSGGAAGLSVGILRNAGATVSWNGAAPSPGSTNITLGAAGSAGSGAQGGLRAGTIDRSASGKGGVVTAPTAMLTVP